MVSQSGFQRATGHRAGFSLIEVALALLVVAIGLTAIMGLFPAGMQSSRTAIEETEMGEFADFVLSSLEIIAGRNWELLSNTGLDNPANRNMVSTRIMGPNPAPDPDHHILRGGGPHLYVWRPANTEMHTPRPHTSITDILAGQIATRFTYRLQIVNIDANNKYARLNVWPGDQRNIADPDKAMVFYREYRKTN